MNDKCCICKVKIRGLMCHECWVRWPKGMTFGEYANRPYTPKPVVIPAGIGTCEEPPL